MLTEETLRTVFMKSISKYAVGGMAKEVGMENEKRKADLVTIQIYLDEPQINIYEFKLDDYNKVVEQAVANKVYSHRSWIVMPLKKKAFLESKKSELSDQGIGAIVVHDNGRYEFICYPKYNPSKLPKYHSGIWKIGLMHQFGDTKYNLG